MPFYSKLSWTKNSLLNTQKFIIENGTVIIENIKAFQDYQANSIKSSLYLMMKINKSRKRLLERNIIKTELY